MTQKSLTQEANVRVLLDTVVKKKIMKCGICLDVWLVPQRIQLFVLSAKPEDNDFLF